MRTLRQAAAAEWVKLWSVGSTWWCLGGALVLTVLGAVTIGGATATEALREGMTGLRLTASEPVVAATSFAQFGLVAAAMLPITSEYASGTVRVTLQATPVRGTMLAAKALVIAPVMAVAGVLSGAVATVAVQLLLSIDVFGGVAVLPPGEVALDLLGVGAFYAFVSLMTLGTALALRSAAGTLTVMFMLLLGVPMMLMMSQAGLELALRMPTFAGLAFMDASITMTGGPMPYPAAEGLAWLMAWTAVAVVAGHAALRRRDA